MKSTATSKINRDIDFLQFSLNLMKERITYKNDKHNNTYDAGGVPWMSS